jgi:hypothetical protein
VNTIADKRAAVRAALRQVLIELDGTWPCPRAKFHVPGYSRSIRRVAPADRTRYRHFTRHLSGDAK